MSVHLHVRSCYTLLQSTLNVEHIVGAAKRHGFTSVALTDKHVLHGAMAFYHACRKENIHPIIGMEVDIIENEAVFGLILLAKNDTGYQQLMKLSTLLNTTSRKQLLSIEEVSIYTQDCVVLTAGDQDELETWLIKEEHEPITQYLSKCSSYFSDFYVALARNDSGLLQQRNKLLKSISYTVGIPCVALSRIYYEYEEDEEAYQAVCAIHQGVRFDDKMLKYSPRRYFRSQTQMQELYGQDELDATEEIALKCQVNMAFPKASLPQFENRFHVDSDAFLRSLCIKGLQKRMEHKQIPQEYQKRLQYELDVIMSMGFSDYFLIVWDFIRFAKTQDIYIGPGRGSAAGSLVSYCLGITHADPIQYHLLFERFLNPERISMPDIDTDFPDNRRDEVISYVQNRYGEYHVAHILTFNTLAAKQVLRDVGRVLTISPRQIDLLCKLVPNRLKVTLDMAYQEELRFQQIINSNAQLKQLYRICKKLEGLPRHTSLHAAGIVLSKEEISEVCPLIEVEDDVLATQFTMEHLEELGLIKMDFLGLRNLTIIDDIVQHLALDQHPLNIMKIPLNDEKTFQLIQAVDTVGVFQLESEGMKQLLRQMQPKTFEDIVATIALFRPGPMENIPEYLKRREHPEEVDYIHPSLKHILQHTYGIMIYQEQIMQIAQTMAGFTLGKADNLRKAISKKQKDQLQSYEHDFISGAMQKGYTPELAKHVYDLIMKFANYGFNRSHSVAYGMIAYQMAYLKANAPLYFFQALLNSVIGSEMKTNEYIFEARKRGIQILLPSINNSNVHYTIEQQALRFPLIGIKGIGSAVASQILEERKLRGKYQDFFDFTARMCGNKVGKKTIETLIFSGALDEFHVNRASLHATLDDALRYGDLVKIEDHDQILFDFDIVSRPVVTMVKENPMYRCEKEKEYLGCYLSTHPIAMLRQQIDGKLPALVSLRGYRGYAKFICMIERVKLHRTKRGDQMMFLSVSDDTMKFDVVCMPNIYAVHKDDLKVGTYLFVEGKIEKEASCLVKTLRKIER